ncbi:hypothetical protein M413DRAFT_43185, partial [Hebeloma cylindrosporum]
LSFLAIFSLVSAGDICAYTSRNCIGGFGCCSNILPGTCCLFSTGYGWSTRFQNMPQTQYWLGTTYGDRCTTSTGGAGDSNGNICLSVYPGPTYLNAKSANWKADRLNTRSFEGDASESDCMRMNVIGFTTENGEEKRFEVPKDRTFEEVDGFLKAGRYEEL